MWTCTKVKDVVNRAPTLTDLTPLLGTILRGEATTWPAAADSEGQTHFLDACEAHGVTLLVYQHLRQMPTWEEWPINLRSTLAHMSNVQTAMDLVREQELVQVFQALAVHDVRPLLMKGTPLAYTHYAASALRPRCDTDLLIRPDDRGIIQHVLTELGYSRLNAVSGRFVMYQCTYVKHDRYRIRHACDVHWKMSNPQVFADLLEFDELLSQATPVPALGDNVRTLAPVHALLLACLHRVAHHYNSDRLIWLYDIHLLVRGMRYDDLHTFVQLAADKHLKAVCDHSLQLAQQHFATPFPTSLLQTLRVSDGPDSDEATAHFLNPNQRRFHVLLADLGMLSSWRNQCRLLKEHLFPPPEYLLDRYGTTNRLWLPVLYMHRALRGLWRLSQRVM